MAPNRHYLGLIITWLLVSGILSLLLFTWSTKNINRFVDDRVRHHLLSTLDESFFRDAENRVNDEKSIRYMGQRINAALQNVVRSQWYAVRNSCVINLVSIDGILVSEGEQYDQTIRLSIPRNQLDRDVVVGVQCQTNWRPVLIASMVLGLLFFMIHQYFPPPLTAKHRQWINYLTAHGDSGQQAFDLVKNIDSQDLSLGEGQTRILEKLYEAGSGSFSQIIELMNDPRVSSLERDKLEWLLIGLNGDLTKLEDALVLARAPDLVEINLSRNTLRIHGLQIATSKTPFHYYAWYAQKRLDGEGWLTNPASNRPDRKEGRLLAQFMWRYGGHAKAISFLEEHGLTAKNLDQNRCKIKEEIVEVLGEDLAFRYSFESGKHDASGRTAYRLRIERDKIQLS